MHKQDELSLSRLSQLLHRQYELVKALSAYKGPLPDGRQKSWDRLNLAIKRLADHHLDEAATLLDQVEQTLREANVPLEP